MSWYLMAGVPEIMFGLAVALVILLTAAGLRWSLRPPYDLNTGRSE